MLASGATTLAILAIGLDASARGALDGPVLVGLVLATLACFEAPAALVRAVVPLTTALSAKRRIEVLVASPIEGAGRSGAALPPGADLAFAGVSFAYRADRPILRDVSFTCRPGSRTALVGESGCGKSTIFRLLLGLAKPTGGRVCVAGADIGDADLEDLRGRVTLMEQGAPVFLGSVRDNLLLGRPEASEQELWDALARARLDRVVANLPAGLDSWCGEGGLTLSAGQARRLCLARALLTPASVLLLDEPTSGLDPETEQEFLADLAQATAGRTVLIATHATLPPDAVDAILLLENGALHRIGGTH